MFLNVGEMYGPGSNIGSRADTLQISNIDANKYWYTETVYSKNRDKALFPNPAKYVVPLSRNYKQVLEVELLSAQIPISTYIIDCRDPILNNVGNNSFRFNEGYIIDNGNLYGICNDRLTIREYSDASLVARPSLSRDRDQSCCPEPFCESSCTVSEVEFPRTLSQIRKITASGTCHGSHSGPAEVKITTVCNHNLTCKYTPLIYVVDAKSENCANVNGQYQVTKICDRKSFLAVPSPCCQSPDLEPTSSCSSQVSRSSHAEDEDFGRDGWLYVPRIRGPHELAEMVQDYLNQCANPPVKNCYSVTFNDFLGRFIFTRASGLQLFDLLAGSDERSILSATMGFAHVDYFYGQYNHLTSGQTRLPSEALCESIRPDIHSETVGESAVVSVCRGNYTPGGLADTLTIEMQRPLIQKGKNDLLTVQLMGQVVKICVPCGMYDPQNLIEAIAKRMSAAYCCIGSPEGAPEDELSDEEYFIGRYCVRDGSFTIESTDSEPFGLLFTCSTIGALLGFEKIDLTGNCSYTSMNSIFFPVTNRRFTDQVYSVTSHLKDLTYRFTKCGAFQAPIVKIAPTGPTQSLDKDESSSDTSCSDEESHGVRVFTWTRECGGCAHGFQVGDIMTIEGQDDIITEPPFVGVHVVQKVYDAFSFQLSLKLLNPTEDCLGAAHDCGNCNNDNMSSSSCSKKNHGTAFQRFGPYGSVRAGGGTKIRSTPLTDNESCNCSKKERHQFAYVASHWFQPFSLFFPGVADPINEVLGFPVCVSGCADYVGPNQWNLIRQRDVYINIQELCSTDNGRICKSSDSGCNSKYNYNIFNSFVRIPLSVPTQEGIEFGLLSASSYQRKRRFTMNTKDLYEVSVTLVDECGNLINFHGRDHSFDLRILCEQ